MKHTKKATARFLPLLLLLLFSLIFSACDAPEAESAPETESESARETQGEENAPPLTAETLFDRERAHMPSEEDIAKITDRMPLKEVVSLIGLPHEQVYPHIHTLLKWYTANGTEFYIRFKYENLPEELLQSRDLDTLIEYGAVMYGTEDAQVFTIPVYTSFTADIDHNGDEETCLVRHGDTSGLFSIEIIAYDPETKKIEYGGQYVLNDFSRYFSLSMTEDGILRLHGWTDDGFEQFFDVIPRESGIFGLAPYPRPADIYYGYDRVEAMCECIDRPYRILTEEEQRILHEILDSYEWERTNPFDQQNVAYRFCGSREIHYQQKNGHKFNNGILFDTVAGRKLFLTEEQAEALDRMLENMVHPSSEDEP